MVGHSGKSVAERVSRPLLGCSCFLMTETCPYPPFPVIAPHSQVGQVEISVVHFRLQLLLAELALRHCSAHVVQHSSKASFCNLVWLPERRGAAASQEKDRNFLRSPTSYFGRRSRFRRTLFSQPHPKAGSAKYDFALTINQTCEQKRLAKTDTAQ